MKLQLYWFLTVINMASASQIHDREGALRQDIWPRGDEYTACVTTQVDSVVALLNQRVPEAQECFATARHEIVDVSLPKITTLPISERQEAIERDFAAMVSPHGLEELHKLTYSYMDLQLPKLEECMRQTGIPERIVHRVARDVMVAKFRAHMLCHDAA